MAAVLAFAVDAGHLALDVQRRSPIAALQPTDGLVERAVAVVVLAALCCQRVIEPRRGLSLAFLCGEQEGDNRTEAVWKSSSELGYNVASMASGGRTLIST